MCVMELKTQTSAAELSSYSKAVVSFPEKTTHQKRSVSINPELSGPNVGLDKIYWWQAAHSPHIQRPESVFPWCGWCHEGARCLYASGLSEEKLQTMEGSRAELFFVLRQHALILFLISSIIKKTTELTTGTRRHSVLRKTKNRQWGYNMD